MRIKFTTAIISCALWFVMAISPEAQAHSGGLNQQGCHNNHKTGGYHCHRSGTGTEKLILSSYDSQYDRREWKFRASYSLYNDSKIGFYTGIITTATDVDHIVSLKDAYVSGGRQWSAALKKRFANDAANHAPALARVNSIKGSRTPKAFIEAMEENYSFYSQDRKCEYVQRYHYVKQKYGLSFDNNDMNYISRILSTCG